MQPARLRAPTHPAADRPVPSAPSARTTAQPPVTRNRAGGLKLKLERALQRRGYGVIVGVDEVGRGPLAGPVTAAAVILDPRNLPKGLRDSKALVAELRDTAYVEIMARATAVAVGFASVAEIDRINILQATYLAMRRALSALPLQPDYLVVDGRSVPAGWTGAGEAIIKGDATCASIAAASIVAKVMRDRMMIRHHRHDPRYGFDRHKGYATADHRDALQRFGPSPIHRRSFAPCADPADEENLPFD